MLPAKIAIVMPGVEEPRPEKTAEIREFDMGSVIEVLVEAL